MKKTTNENKFFGLNASEKAKIVRQAVDKATKEQLDLVNKHGGIKTLKNYSICN
jgi:adenylate kinase